MGLFRDLWEEVTDAAEEVSGDLMDLVEDGADLVKDIWKEIF